MFWVFVGTYERNILISRRMWCKILTGRWLLSPAKIFPVILVFRSGINPHGDPKHLECTPELFFIGHICCVLHSTWFQIWLSIVTTTPSISDLKLAQWWFTWEPNDDMKSHVPRFLFFRAILRKMGYIWKWTALLPKFALWHISVGFEQKNNIQSCKPWTLRKISIE